MKKLKLALLLVVVMTVMLVFATVVKLTEQRRDMEARGPLTVEEIDKLSADWGVARPGEPTVALNPPKDQEDPPQALERQSQKSPTDSAGPPVHSDSLTSSVLGAPPAARPPVMNTLPKAQMEQMAAARRQANRRLFGAVVSPLCELIATTGLPVSSYLEAANIAYYWNGDLETAKRLYRETLHRPAEEEYRHSACFHLALMEEDPQVADRLIELGCPANEENPLILAEAVTFAHETHNTELFEYYLARLQAVSPQRAERYRLLWSRNIH